MVGGRDVKAVCEIPIFQGSVGGAKILLIKF